MHQVNLLLRVTVPAMRQVIQAANPWVVAWAPASVVPWSVAWQGWPQVTLCRKPWKAITTAMQRPKARVETAAMCLLKILRSPI